MDRGLAVPIQQQLTWRRRLLLFCLIATVVLLTLKHNIRFMIDIKWRHGQGLPVL